jgi:hypothetical protein
MLKELARRKGVRLPESPDSNGELDLDREYDRLADWVRSSLDMDLVYELAGLNRDFEGTQPMESVHHWILRSPRVPCGEVIDR